MSTSPIIDANYRLHPADLAGAARQVVIANVTFQGVEAMTPVLHFVGQTKRLVLTPEQVQQIVAITGTSLFTQWHGVTLILQPKRSKKQTTIEVKAVTAHQRNQPMPLITTEDKRGWRLSFAVVSLLLLFSTIYATINATQLLTAIEQLRDNWLLR
jgi:hypothetical protein